MTIVINGKVVGKLLKSGTGRVMIDPAMCAHPTAMMKRRGNKMKWWSCTQCQSRWERHTPGEVAPEGIPQGSKIRHTQGSHRERHAQGEVAPD